MFLPLKIRSQLTRCASIHHLTLWPWVFWSPPKKSGFLFGVGPPPTGVHWWSTSKFGSPSFPVKKNTRRLATQRVACFFEISTWSWLVDTAGIEKLRGDSPSSHGMAVKVKSPQCRGCLGPDLLLTCVFCMIKNKNNQCNPPKKGETRWRSHFPFSRNCWMVRDLVCSCSCESKDFLTEMTEGCLIWK